MEKILIKMPRISNNDDFVTLECWCVSKGDFVKKGDLLWRIIPIMTIR